jgi:hypothetical protein
MHVLLYSLPITRRTPLHDRYRALSTLHVSLFRRVTYLQESASRTRNHTVIRRRDRENCALKQAIVRGRRRGCAASPTVTP